MDDDSRLSLEQEIADLRFALRQATDRASLAEIKCSQLLAAWRLTKDEEWAIAQAILAYDLSDDDEACAKIAADLRGLLERHK
jgi:hypothetical protein